MWGLGSFPLISVSVSFSVLSSLCIWLVDVEGKLGCCDLVTQFSRGTALLQNHGLLNTAASFISNKSSNYFWELYHPYTPPPKFQVPSPHSGWPVEWEMKSLTTFWVCHVNAFTLNGVNTLSHFYTALCVDSLSHCIIRASSSSKDLTHDVNSVDWKDITMLWQWKNEACTSWGGTLMCCIHLSKVCTWAFTTEESHLLLEQKIQLQRRAI